MLLSQLLGPDHIRVPLSSRDKPGVLRELVEFLVATSGGEVDDILHGVREREECQSTGFGYGVAIPHARTPTLSSLAIVAGVASQPIEFGALDAQPVRLFFLVAGPESAAGAQVRALARIARLVRRDSVRAQLIEAATPQAFHGTMSAAERAGIGELRQA